MKQICEQVNEGEMKVEESLKRHKKRFPCCYTYALQLRPCT